MDGLTEVRRVLYALRGKEDAKPRGLHAIDRLIAIFKVASQAEVQVDYTNAAGEWDERSDAAVFYFVREALTNAMKHGGANRISVLFQIHEETLEVIVEDDGAGASDVKEGIGLTGMRERFGPLGGTLSYSTGPVGFEIRATIPLKEG
jgi:signal transduction histidine kinase